MFETYFPDFYFRRVEDIPIKFLAENNIKGLIFDMDNTTVMKSTREYLKKASKEKRVINVSYDLPKSFIVSAEDTYRVYISLLSSATISSRAKNKSRRFE